MDTPDGIERRGSGVFTGLLRIVRGSARPPSFARFDPVRVESEFYDAIYAERTGNVDNVVPLASRHDRPEPARQT